MGEVVRVMGGETGQVRMQAAEDHSAVSVDR